MATRVNAYRSKSGKLFESEKEARDDEIEHAIQIISASDSYHLKNVASGHSMCRTTREAICLLADCIREIPYCEPSTQTAV